MTTVTAQHVSRRRGKRRRPSGVSLALTTRRRLGMSQRVFARLAAVSERSLVSYEKGRPAGDSTRRQLTQIARLEAVLAKVMNVKALGKWFEEPNTAFDGLKPLEVIERGEIDRLWAMIHQLESGTAS